MPERRIPIRLMLPAMFPPVSMKNGGRSLFRPNVPHSSAPRPTWQNWWTATLPPMTTPSPSCTEPASSVPFAITQPLPISQS